MTRPVQQIGYEILKEFLVMNQRRMDRENQIAAGINISKSFYNINNMDKSEKDKSSQNNYYEYFLSDNKDKDETLWGEVEFLDMFEQMGIYINEWCKIFNEEDLENCFDKVDVINYKEEVKLRHNINLNLHASGLHIGSCYWTFDTGLEKITLIDGVATHSFRHCMSCDLDPLLKSSTIILTNCLNNIPLEGAKHTPNVSHGNNLTQLCYSDSKKDQNLDNLSLITQTDKNQTKHTNNELVINKLASMLKK